MPSNKTVVLKNNNLLDFISILTKDLLTSLTLTFNKDEIRILTTNISVTTFIDVSFKDNYEKCNLKDEITVRADLIELQTIIKTKEKEERTAITFLGDKMEIKFFSNINETNSGYTKHRLSLQNVEEEAIIDISGHESTTRVNMNSKYFTSILKKVALFDTSLTFDCIEDETKLLIKSGSSDKFEMNAIIGPTKVHSLTIEDDVSIKIDIKDMIVLSKSDKFAENVTIHLTYENTQAICIEYNFDNNSSIKFFTSPQFDEDDSDDDFDYDSDDY